MSELEVPTSPGSGTVISEICVDQVPPALANSWKVQNAFGLPGCKNRAAVVCPSGYRDHLGHFFACVSGPPPAIKTVGFENANGHIGRVKLPDDGFQDSHNRSRLLAENPITSVPLALIAIEGS